MYIIAVLISIVAWVASLLFLNQATMGVGAVGAACWFAILARIIQQDKHHRDLMHAIRQQRQEDQASAQPPFALDPPRMPRT